MKETAIIFPVIVQALMSIGLLFLLLPARKASLAQSKKTFDDRDVSLGEYSWSDTATKIGNNFSNQFELPVLFYAVAAFAMLSRGVDYVMLVLAWVFVVSRVVHAIVHIGPNVVAVRGATYLVGVIALIAMWLKLLIHLL